MRRSLFFFLLLPLVLLTAIPLAAQDAKPEQKKSEPRVYHVPYRLTPVYHLLVRVKINEKGPFNVIIDSGCNIVIMTPSAARQFGLGAASGGKLDKIEFEGGPVILNNRVNINVPAQVAALNKNNAEGAELHGVIGCDILRHCKLDLDYSSHKLVWTQGGDGKAEPDPKAITLPLEVSSSGHIYVKVQLNGNGPYRFLYDTGSPGVVVSPKLMRGTNKAAVVETLEIGDLKARKVPVVTMAPPNFGGATDGIIGFPLIARYRTSMDLPNKKLTFAPGSYEPPFVPWSVMTGKPGKQPEPAPSAEDTWGLVVAKEDGDRQPGVTLRMVLPATSGHALGLRSGDRLLTFDDTWTDGPLDVNWAASRAKLGPGVRAKVLRDGRTLTIDN